MKKKLISTLLTVATVVSMTACGVSAPETPAAQPAADAQASDAAPADAAAEPAKDAITLVMAEVNPLDSISGMTDAKFKEEVEKRSNGSIIIDLQANQVLGAEQDVLDTMLGGGGTIDLARISAFSLTSYGGESSMLLSLPYTFVSREHFWNFATSDLAKQFLLEPSENGSGVRGLFYGEEGFRHFFTTKEISGIDSLKGLKLRVSNDPVMNGLVEGLGASPTVVAFTELYGALQTGVVDGAEQPIANYASNSFNEVAGNMILDGHTLGAIQVIITDDAWNKLSADQQDILMAAGEEASKYNRSISEEKEKEVLEQLKANGTKITEVEDIKPWQDAVKKVVEENIKGKEDVYQQILDMQ
ncbi:tripartite ATP-independent transporter solute receptor, DctP family [Butyrivibrio hungatei]|jgi:tripartite ATP-independent transporter DctP family solute receptor|uniref:Tripartite ATP-independent transporter solute receptor, DctP family n=1 Tax=Butyrivibrio hungatei TaxID=185008 RepID=A0A1G5AB64_9FIRM|nr:TRAP transporter substrate-binding protein [Butyrivibrio hungatei]MBQ4218327.1 TRAP transporter substrate-binding protein [Butyrivibrio sp.]MEE3470185.1 TRAP transporter substrate-binding protein [Butyrivibrio hungatei]SCX75112.1 tripartite ATP-independent transporter solute receptor, DctP family [Butyrivibrio hungatei]